jgi:ribosomal protein L11 methyltransferase
MDFEGFEQEDNLLIASVPANRFDDVKREEIIRSLVQFDGAELINEELISPQNWNQKWEQSIQPQSIGKFYVRPTWAEKLPYRWKIPHTRPFCSVCNPTHFATV